jgi:hypothetical protein
MGTSDIEAAGRPLEKANSPEASIKPTTVTTKRDILMFALLTGGFISFS